MEIRWVSGGARVNAIDLFASLTSLLANTRTNTCVTGMLAFGSG